MFLVATGASPPVQETATILMSLTSGAVRKNTRETALRRPVAHHRAAAGIARRQSTLQTRSLHPVAHLLQAARNTATLEPQRRRARANLPNSVAKQQQPLLKSYEKYGTYSTRPTLARLQWTLEPRGTYNSQQRSPLPGACRGKICNRR